MVTDGRSRPRDPRSDGGGQEREGTEPGDVLSRALQLSTVAVLISDPRLDGCPIVWVNAAFERMTGYSCGQVVGRNARLLHGPRTDRAQVRRAEVDLAGGRATRYRVQHYRADGSGFHDEVSQFPVYDPQGRITHHVAMLHDASAQVALEDDRARLQATLAQARAAADRARTQLSVLEELGAALSQSLQVDETVRRVTRAVVPTLADWCAVDLVPLPVAGPGGHAAAEHRRVSAAHRDPALEPLVWELGRLAPGPAGIPALPADLSLQRSVLVERLTAAEVAEHAAGNPELQAVLAGLRLHAAAVVPLRARGALIGSLTLAIGRDSGRSLGAEELALAELLATRAALAVDNAILFAAESAERRRADALSEAGIALAGSLRRADVLDVLLRLVVPEFADWAFVHLDGRGLPTMDLPATAGLQVVASRHADPLRAASTRAFLDRFPVTPGQPGPARAWETGRPEVIPPLQDLVLAGTGHATPEEGSTPATAPRAAGGGGGVSVPLTARDTTVGALTLIRHAQLPYTPEELRFVADLGRRAALALANAGAYEAEQVAALELQRWLLPARLPTVDGLDIAARYLAAGTGAAVGGDWYDVVRLPDGEVGVSIGDVMGRGLRAAAVMGQLRSALRGYAVEGLPPARVLARLASFSALLDGEQLATCCYGVHDPRTARVLLASAGHPAPLLVPAGGAARWVGPGPGLPLGVAGPEVAPEDYPQVAVPLAPGDTLLLFTDGLIEDRGTSMEEGLARLLGGFAARPPASAEDACGTALRIMGRDLTHADDIAVLAVRAVPPSNNYAQ